eukprot:gnl/Chilomastix_cuspidata/1195.p1 GENE.gnl/Chilomastix_cuspidata/1195~~gnl/Chilomastix_cuspidata/1195.p1  ORF type:complete len:389 (+),score=119.81 gnl/Chilomastix_cuspidata/1195:51-1217(+)
MCENQFKVIIIGEPHVGKTSIIKAVVDGLKVKEEQSYKTTIGVDFRQYPSDGPLKIGSHFVHLNLWDIGGQERLTHRLEYFYRDSHVAFIVTDVDSLSRSLTPEGQVTIRKQSLGEGKIDLRFPGNDLPVPVFLVINKIDKKSDETWPATLTRIKRFVKANEFAGYHLTSAVTGEGLSELMLRAARVAHEMTYRVFVNAGIWGSAEAGRALLSALGVRELRGNTFVFPLEEGRDFLDTERPDFHVKFSLKNMLIPRDSPPSPIAFEGLDSIVVPVSEADLRAEARSANDVGQILDRMKPKVYPTDVSLPIIVACVGFEPSCLPTIFRSRIFSVVTVSSPDDFFQFLSERYFYKREMINGADEYSEIERIDIDEDVAELESDSKRTCCK